MEWDGMGYTVGTGVATAQKIVKRPTTFLPRLYYSNDSQSKVTQNPPLELFFYLNIFSFCQLCKLLTFVNLQFKQD